MNISTDEFSDLGNIMIIPVFKHTKKAPNNTTIGLSRSASLSLIHISEPTRLGMISYAVFCLKKKRKPRAAGSTPKAVPAEGDPKIRVSY